MNNIRRGVLCLIILLAGSHCLSQKKLPLKYQVDIQSVKNPIYKSILNSSQNNNVLKRLENLGIKGDAAEWFAAMNYSDKSITELNKQDIDIVRSLRDFHGRDEKAKAALSDCIVIGTVSKIEYDSSDVPFHTKAYVKVDRYLRNDYDIRSDEILVAVQSGPMGNGLWTQSNHEDKLTIGENVLLFLSASAFLIETKYNRPQYFQQLVNSETIVFETLGRYKSKYVITKDKVSLMGKNRQLNDVVNEITSVAKILRKPPFNK